MLAPAACQCTRLHNAQHRKVHRNVVPAHASEATGDNVTSNHASRRMLLEGITLAALLPAGPSLSRTLQVATCDPSEGGQACRMAELDKDSEKRGARSLTEQSEKLNAVTTVPVAVLDDAYVKATLDLGDTILQYTTLDPYDPDRIMAIRKLKKNGPSWVSQYARGGSARSQSARRFYIVVDAVLGFIASNGIAPFPAGKMAKITGNIKETKELLAQGL